MIISGETARLAIYGDHPDWEIVQDEKSVDEVRWAVIYQMILRHIPSDQLYEFEFHRGTGDEGERPYEYDDKVEVWAVMEKQVTTTVYERL